MLYKHVMRDVCTELTIYLIIKYFRARGNCIQFKSENTCLKKKVIALVYFLDLISLIWEVNCREIGILRVIVTINISLRYQNKTGWLAVMGAH